MTLWSRPLRPSDPEGFAWLGLPGTTDNLGRFQEFILDIARQHQAPPDVLLKIEMVLEEVLLNIINHAYYGEGTGFIKTGCRFSDDGMFIIRVIDQGIPFDPSSRPDPDTSLAVEDRDIGGLGIFLVRQMSDQVEHQRADGQNILQIIFRL